MQVPEPPVPVGGWQLTDKNAMIRKLEYKSFLSSGSLKFPFHAVDDSNDVFGESNEVCLPMIHLAIILTPC